MAWDIGSAQASGWDIGSAQRDGVPTYTLTYDDNGADGGIVPTDPGLYASGQYAVIQDNVGSLYLNGYEFSGWNTQSDGYGTTYQSGNFLYFTDSHITLYAVWSAVIYDPFFPGNEDSYLSSLVKAGRKIKAWIGFELPDSSIEYVPYGTFWSGEWSTPNDSPIVTVSGRDRLELLRRAVYMGCEVQINITLYDLLEIVLNNAVISIPMPDLTWQIDTELQNIIVPNAWFDKQNYKSAIQLIASACVGQAYMDRNDVLIVESYKANIPTSTSYEYQTTDSAIYNRDNPVKEYELTNDVNVKINPIIEASASSTVYTSTEFIPMQAFETKIVEVRYTAAPVVNASAGIVNNGGLAVSITNVDYYAWGAVITVSSITPYNGAIKLGVTGTIMEDAGSENVESTDLSSIKEKGLLSYDYPDNSLIQTIEHGEYVADACVLLYKESRRDASITWIGYPPVELSDIIEIPEYQRRSIDNRGNYIVYKNNITVDSNGMEVQTEGRKVNVVDIPPEAYQDTDGSGTTWQDTDTGTDHYQDTDD